MQAVDISMFLVLIDDMLLYNPVTEKVTLEALVPARSNYKSLRIFKQLTSGHLEIEVLPDSMRFTYFLSGSESHSGKLEISPPNESSESIRDKLRPIIILDAQSKKIPASADLDLLRPERPI